jgi:caffeoyl-CoA O-methyltransferase
MAAQTALTSARACPMPEPLGASGVENKKEVSPMWAGRRLAWIGAPALALVAGAGVIAFLAGSSPTAGDGLAGLPDTPALQTIRAMGEGQGVSPAEGRHMYDLILANHYRRGLDVGTAHGYSALWFGMAVARSGGSVVTIEIDPAAAEAARANFRRAGLSAVIDSRINDAFTEIPRLAGEFDFVFLDTGLGEDQRFLDLLRARIRPGGVLMAHNATFMRWQQPEFWRSIHTRSAFDTSIFGRVAIAVKRGTAAR